MTSEREVYVSPFAFMKEARGAGVIIENQRYSVQGSTKSMKEIQSKQSDIIGEKNLLY